MGDNGQAEQENDKGIFMCFDFSKMCKKIKNLPLNTK
jgi:hypothetical protein